MSHFLELKRSIAIGGVVVIATTFSIACGDRHTMAMKSQKAFEEAQKKGIPIAKGGHGGHEAMGNEEMSGMPAATSSGAMEGMDHANMPGMTGTQMAGMDHSKMAGMSEGQMAGMDHSKMNMQPGQAMAGMDHSKMNMQPGQAMAGMDHSKMNMQPGQAMAGMDHSKMNMQPGQAMAGMDHSKMNMQPGQAMAGMDHSKMNMQPGQPMAGMDHSKMNMQPGQSMAGMQHGSMPGMKTDAMEMPAPAPLPETIAAQPGQPAATLRGDPLDAPAPTSIEDAAKTDQMSREMAGGGGMMMGPMNYRQIDAGRNDLTPPASSPMPPQGHGQMQMPMDAAPAPASSTPAPRTSGHEHAAAAKTKAAAPVYVCPMHPEVTSDRPGIDPKCGMKLVLKKEKK